MLHGFGRSIKRSVYRRAARRREDAGNEILLTLMVGIGAAIAFAVFLGFRLRPVAAAAAQTQAENTINRLIEKAVLEDLNQRSVGYRDFMVIERDNSGAITALTADMAAMNHLRGVLLECVLDALEGIQISDVQIPLGSLLGIDVLWAIGPRLKVYSMSVGTVSAEFESEFDNAGVNQTLHRIWLEVCVPLKLMLPGQWVETCVETRLCVTETVIVGQVPDTYLHMAAGEAA